MSSRYTKVLFSVLFLCASYSLSAQIIWQEDFSGANMGWTDNFTDCDFTAQSFNGVRNGRYEIQDMEGAPCCTTGGGGGNEWITNPIPITGNCSVSISVDYGFVGVFECEPGGPWFGCQNNVAIDNGHDQIVFSYSVDGGPFVQFGYVCGGQSGTITTPAAPLITGTNIVIKIEPSNKSTGEIYWFDNVVVSAAAAPTVNQPADITVCAGQPVPAIVFTGTGTPAPTFAWTNNNTAIGLGASGNGNIPTFTPSAAITTQQVATVTVTPTSGTCSGPPVTFTITVNPRPTVNQPPNYTFCAGDMVDIMFSGNSPTATYNWVVNPSFPGFPVSGTGNIMGNVPTPIPFSVTGTITVTPTENGCPGTPKSFTITLQPTPTANMTLTSNPNICAGGTATFSVSFSGQSPYTFTYSINGVNQTVTTSANPFILTTPPLSVDAIIAGVSLTTGSNCMVSATGGGNINVSPTPTATLTSGGSAFCAGQPLDLTVTFNGTDIYTFIYRINGIAQPPITTTGPTYTLSINPGPGAGITIYSLASVTSNGCPGTVSGSYTATVTAAPTAFINGGGSICSGQNSPVSIDFMSGGPAYTFIYSINGTDQPPITTTNDPYIFPPTTYTTTTTLSLESVTSNGCTGTATGQAIITVAPSPTAALTGTATVCTGQTANLTVTFTGTGPFTFNYTAAGVAQPPITTSNNPYTLMVTPATTTTYILTGVTAVGCTGTVSGSAVVTTGATPTATLSGAPTVCAGQSANLTVTFTGTGPYTFNYTAAGVAQTPITTSANPYTLVVTPATTTTYVLTSLTTVGCAGTVSGSSVVTIGGSPTATLAGNATVCAGQPTNLTVTFTGTGPYTFNYTAGGVAQTPVTTSNNPYTLAVTPAVTTTYTLTSLTTPGCAGTVAGSATVTIGGGPTAVLSGTTTICAGQSANLTVTFTGTAPFIFLYTVDGVGQTPITTSSNPYTLTVSPTVATTYVLFAVADNNCDGTVSGSAVVTIGGNPTAALSGTTAICAGQTANLTVSFTGTGPFTFNYTAGGLAQPPVTTASNPYTLVVTPAVTTNYLLTSVTTGSCTGTTSGSAAVTVNPGPTATLVSGTSTICAGQSQSMTINFTGTGPYTFVYALNGVNQAPVTTVGPGYTLVLTPANGINIITLVSVSNPTCSGGATSGSFTIDVRATPTAVIDGDTTICGIGSPILTVTFTGTGPYTYVYAVDGVAQPPITTSNNPDTLAPFPLDTTVYSLVSVTAGGCPGTVSGSATVTIAPSLTAVISGGGQICQGNSSGASVTISFQGQAPYTFVYSINNTLQPPITTSLNPYIITVNPPIGTIYKLVSVTNLTCIGTTSGQANVFVFSPPTALMTGTQSFCNTAVTNVSVDFTGTGPFTIIYSKDGVLQPAVTTFDDPYFIPVNTTASTTTYVLTSVESPGCVGVPTGSATITVHPTPSFAGVDQTCNATNTNYTVQFNILNGTPPYTLVSGSGTFTGNTFTSSSLLISQNYSFVFHDSFNCGNVTVSGTPNCNCTTDAGTMSGVLVSACENSAVTVASTAGQVSDADDQLRYILHSNQGLPIGTIFAWSSIPTFNIQPGMTPGVTYYISAVAGNANGPTMIDLTDPCLSVNSGTPVVFQPQPTAVLTSFNAFLCTGDSLTLIVTFTGTPPFSFVAAYDSVLQPAVTNILTTTYTWNIGPTQNVLITIDSIADQNCSMGAISGADTISVYGPPTLANLTTSCDFTTATYTVTFTVSPGYPPFEIDNLTGTFTGNNFVSDPIPFGTPFTGTVRDSFICGETVFNGVSNCSCTTDAGTMAGTVLLEFCQADSANAPHNGNQMLDSDDVLVFVLHDGTGTTLGNILATSNSPVFAFIPGVTVLGTTYFITAMAGTNDGSGGIVPTDPCLNIAPGTPVRWNVTPTVTMSGAFDVCKGISQTIPVTFTGKAPFSFTYTNNGAPVTTTAAQNTFNIIVNLQNSATFIPTAVTDANGCVGTVSGQATVTVHQAPVIANPTVICSADFQTYTVEFDVLNVSPAPGNVTITGTVPGSLNSTTGHFTSNSIASTLPYTFLVVDSQFNCGQDTASGVSLCNCVTDAGALGTTPLLLCAGTTATFPAATGTFLEPNDTLLYVLATGTDPANWVILAINSIPSFAYNPATMLPGTAYFVVAVAGNKTPSGVDLNDPCLSIIPGPTVTWRIPPTATISGTDNLCTGESATLNVAFTGAGPFDFIYTVGGTQQSGTAAANTAILLVMPTTTTNYGLFSVTGAGGCPGTVSGSAVVTVNPPPTATISGDTALCLGGSTAFAIQMTGVGPYKLVYAINGIAQPQVTAPQNTFFISTTNLQQNQTFTLISVEDVNCTGTVSGTATVTIQPSPSAGLQKDATICAGDSITLTLQLSGGSAYNVTIGGGLAPLQLNNVQNGATVTVKPLLTTTYSITNLVATGNNCPVLSGASAKITVSTLTATATVSDYGGTNISCANETDGQITLAITSGTPPYTANWNNGATGLQLNNLSDTTYKVVLKDAVGCMWTDSFTLTAPPELSIRFTTQKPNCYNDTNGSISVSAINGGTKPYMLLVNGLPTQTLDTFPVTLTGLASGNYQLSVEDANGCSTEETASIPAPVELLVQLGPDTTLRFGDSIFLSPQHTADKIGTFTWTKGIEFLSSPGNLESWARPTHTQIFEISITDTSGCKASDQRLIVVAKANRVYVPNVFNPDAGNFNDGVTVFAGPEVRNVKRLEIYDRWGELLFENQNFLPSDPNLGWNGRSRGEKVNPGVYVYVVEVEYFDGTTDLFSGDVTVVR